MKLLTNGGGAYNGFVHSQADGLGAPILIWRCNVHRFVLAALAAGITVLAVASPASSQQRARDYYQTEKSGFWRDLGDAEDVLKGKPRAEWTQKEQEDYLFNALYAIYFATNAYVCEYGRHPGSREDLASFAGLDPWPGNPYDNWEPLEWEDYPAGEFVPGGLIRQLCPPALWSDPWDPRPKTYVLSINGPAEDYSPMDPTALKVFFEGSTIPSGTAFIAGAGWDSAAKTLERREKSRKAAEEKQRQENK